MKNYFYLFSACMIIVGSIGGSLKLDNFDLVFLVFGVWIFASVFLNAIIKRGK